MSKDMTPEIADLRRRAGLREGHESSPEFVNAIHAAYVSLSDVRQTIAGLHLAPSIDAKFNAHLKEMIDYFDDLMRHERRARGYPILNWLTKHRP